MNKAIAKIVNVGYNLNGNTVLYALGQSAEIADASFKVVVDEGAHSMYTTDIRDTLIGAFVEIEYNGVNDVRVPQQVKFVRIV